MCLPLCILTLCLTLVCLTPFLSVSLSSLLSLFLLLYSDTLSRRPLTDSDSARVVELDIRGTAITSTTGHTAILPRNDEKRVAHFLSFYHLDGNDSISIRPVKGNINPFPPVLTVSGWACTCACGCPYICMCSCAAPTYVCVFAILVVLGV